MVLSRVISSAFDSVLRRITKIRTYGKSIETGVEAAPYGIDSNPIAGMVAVYAETSSSGKQVIVGYINKGQLAQPGEHRSYSTDNAGVLKFYIWQKSDGTCEIGGSSKHMVRYEELKAGWDQMMVDLNSARAALTLPPSTADIVGAKINEVKTL